MAILDIRTGKSIAAPTFTRRKVLGGLAGILATGTAPAAFIRSAIAARSALTSGGGWKNPYVTEGLIAMWDGEWNAGGGKHKRSITVWKDLSGNGNDLQLYSDSGISFGDDYIYHSAITDSGGLGPGLTLSEVPLTMEAVVLVEDALGSASGVIVAGPPITQTSGCCIVAKSISSSDGFFEWGYHWCAWKDYAATKGHVRSLSATQSLGYVNWLKCSDEDTDIWGFNGKVSLMGDARSVSNQIKGRLYTVRLYNKELSVEQRYANYLVDADRFTLT